MRKILMVCTMCATLILCSAFFAACGETKNIKIEPYYLVTVIGGSGGGNYYEDSIVAVTPDTPEGKQFMYWEIDGEAVSSNEKYVFVVKKDTTIIAHFADDVDLSKASVSQEGTIGGEE